MSLIKNRCGQLDDDIIQKIYLYYAFEVLRDLKQYPNNNIIYIYIRILFYKK
jgi:hypothetical protein